MVEAYSSQNYPQELKQAIERAEKERKTLGKNSPDRDLFKGVADSAARSLLQDILLSRMSRFEGFAWGLELFPESLRMKWDLGLPLYLSDLDTATITKEEVIDAVRAGKLNPLESSYDKYSSS